MSPELIPFMTSRRRTEGVASAWQKRDGTNEVTWEKTKQARHWFNYRENKRSYRPGGDLSDTVGIDHAHSRPKNSSSFGSALTFHVAG
jgi:hypothetical protein